MQTPWQLTWVCQRLAPLWMVEQLAGLREKRIRVSFLDARPEEVERVTLGLSKRLGEGWHIEVDALRMCDPAPSAAPPSDLIWAPLALTQVTWHARLELVTRLGASLAPGGYLIADPTEVAAWGAGLSACSSPGVFIKSPAAASAP
jgi:hypothetical protein